MDLRRFSDIPKPTTVDNALNASAQRQVVEAISRQSKGALKVDTDRGFRATAVRARAALTLLNPNFSTDKLGPLPHGAVVTHSNAHGYAVEMPRLYATRTDGLQNTLLALAAMTFLWFMGNLAWDVHHLGR